MYKKHRRQKEIFEMRIYRSTHQEVVYTRLKILERVMRKKSK